MGSWWQCVPPWQRGQGLGWGLSGKELRTEGQICSPPVLFLMHKGGARTAGKSCDVLMLSKGPEETWALGVKGTSTLEPTPPWIRNTGPHQSRRGRGKSGAEGTTLETAGRSGPYLCTAPSSAPLPSQVVGPLSHSLPLSCLITGISWCEIKEST